MRAGIIIEAKMPQLTTPLEPARVMCAHAYANEAQQPYRLSRNQILEELYRDKAFRNAVKKCADHKEWWEDVLNEMAVKLCELREGVLEDMHEHGRLFQYAYRVCWNMIQGKRGYVKRHIYGKEEEVYEQINDEGEVMQVDFPEPECETVVPKTITKSDLSAMDYSLENFGCVSPRSLKLAHNLIKMREEDLSRKKFPMREIMIRTILKYGSTRNVEKAIKIDHCTVQKWKKKAILDMSSLRKRIDNWKKGQLSAVIYRHRVIVIAVLKSDLRDDGLKKYVEEKQREEWRVYTQLKLIA